MPSEQPIQSPGPVIFLFRPLSALDDQALMYEPKHADLETTGL